MPIRNQLPGIFTDLNRVGPVLPLPSDHAQGASKLNPSGSGEQKVATVVAKAGIGDDLMKAGLLGHVRSAVVNNCEDTFIPNIDAPMGETLDRELELFAATFGDRLERESEQTKYATLIQHIQARFKSGGFTYTLDEDSEGVPEYWSTPAEVVADSGQGIDCEDFAFMAKAYGEYMKAELGIGGHFVVHAGLVDHNPDDAHMVAVYYAEDGNQYIIDGTHFASGAGDMSRLKTVAEYTEERNFQWYEASDGTLLEAKLGPDGEGVPFYDFSTRVADITAEGKPFDVVAVEQSRNVNHALVVKAEVEAEPEEYQAVMGFFDAKREWLGGTSLFELGSMVAGPLLIIGDFLKFRSESARVARDRKVAGIKPGARAADQTYHQARRNIAGAKGVMDIARYVAFLVICAGVGALAAPLVALGVGALRCVVGATEALHNGAKKRGRFKRRKGSLSAVEATLGQCHPEVKALLESRMSYKLKKTRLSGSRVFGGLKVGAFGGTAVGMIVTALVAVSVGTLMAVNPVILGVALGFAMLLGLVRGGETLYNGALLREQKRVFRGGESLISSRLKRIRDKKRSWLSRVGASINLVGWVTDAVDDRVATWPRGARGGVKTLLLPFYVLSLLTETKSFNEEAVLGRLGREYARGDVSAKERAALLQTSAAYYGISKDWVLLKWMGSTELDELGEYAETRVEPASPVTRDYLSLWEKKNVEFDASALEETLKARTDVLDRINVKFAGGYGLAGE